MSWSIMKRVKLDIGKGIADAVECIKSTYKPLLILLLIMVAIQIVQSIYYQPISTADFNLAVTDPEIYRTQVANMPRMTGLQTLLSFGLTVLVFLVMTVLITISSRFFSKTEMAIEDVILYSLKKMFTLLLSYLFMMVTFIPIVLVMIILFLVSMAVPAGMIVLFIGFIIGIIVCVTMCIMIQYSIVVEDVGPIKGWLNSIKLVSHNFFRIFFTYMGVMLLSFILRNMLLTESIISVIVAGTVQVSLTMFLTVTMTAVYNQTIDKEPVTVDYRDA